MSKIDLKAVQVQFQFPRYCWSGITHNGGSRRRWCFSPWLHLHNVTRNFQERFAFALALELVYLGPEDHRDSYAGCKEGCIMANALGINLCYCVFERSGCQVFPKPLRIKGPVKNLWLGFSTECHNEKKFIEIKGCIGFVSHGHPEKRNRITYKVNE